jgi:hypothetical protein
MLIIPLSFPIAYAKLVGKGRGISILTAMLMGFGACLAIGLSDKLITSLRTAVENEGVLDKEVTGYDDIFDEFRLALKFYSYKEESYNTH